MTGERMIAGLAAAYFTYRLWSGFGAGIIDGDGDMDVHADRHPIAFALTAMSFVVLIIICSAIALWPAALDIAQIVAWIRKA